MLVIAGCNRQKEMASQPKPRIVITTDPELDDLNSLIRFLLFSTDFRVEGLVYASSQFHWKGDGKGTKWFVPGREYTRFGLNMGPMESWRWAENERFIHDAVEAYEEVYPNLAVHHPNYPDPAYLKSRIRFGNIEFDGDISKDSPGSDLIKSLILDDVPGKLYLAAWGGASTIARALKSIADSCSSMPGWQQLQEKISSKVVLSLSGDQDDTYANYIKPNWPAIEALQSGGGNVSLAYMAQARVKPEDAYLYQPEWVSENISKMGPLGSMYRVWGDGKQMVKGDIFDYFGFSGYTDDELRKMGYIVWAPVQKKGSFLGEGDTYTYLNFIDNGLRALEDQSYGGWSGRKRAGEMPLQWNTPDDSIAYIRSLYGAEPDFPDFAPAVLNSLAARLKWSVTPIYGDANHEPVIDGPLIIKARPGERIKLGASVSDPDGDEVTVRWMQFRVGYSGIAEPEDPRSETSYMVVPSDAKPGESIHMVMEAVDNGTPALTKYHRVIITIDGITDK